MNKPNELAHPAVPQRSPAPGRASAPVVGMRRKLLPVAIALLFAGPLVATNEAYAATPGSTTTPSGGVVVGGVGTITQDDVQTLVSQQSAKLALNWQTFNVGKDASVLFKQPSVSAVALNRILDQNPSQIFGRINSNGQVFLINTHGFIFGATARMNVGGLLASTLDLTPKDFLANHYNLDAHGATAGIVNHGLIQAASGGSVGLVGGSVSNDGVILANYGSIHLDGADRAVLDFDGNGLIQIQVTGALQKRLDSSAAAVANSGTLKADGGTVVLQASAAKNLFTNLVNNSGVVDAGGISTDGGVVRLVASGGNTENSGSIDVSGVHGGSVQLLSDQDVMLTGEAQVNASGTQGGGIVRIGGGVHGGEGLTQAQRTYVAPDASVRADALQSGTGGSVAVWSTGNTVSMGSISARGGALDGNGGFVETSGLQNLTVTSAPNVGATNGVGGTWLIDPDDIAINATGDTNIGTASPFEPTAAGPATIGVDTITTALANGNVVIKTTSAGTGNGDITVNSGFSFDGGSGTPPPTAGKLTLNADGGITFAANQIFAGTGPYALSVDLEAGQGISFAAGSGITANGGDVTLKAAGSGVQLGQISSASLDVTAAGDITQVGALTVSGASSFSAVGKTIALGNASNALTGNVGLTGADVGLVNDATTTLGDVTATGTLSVSSNGNLTQAGGLTADGTATFTQTSTTAGDQDIDLGNASLASDVTFAGPINNLSLTNATPVTALTVPNITGNLALDFASGVMVWPASSVGTIGGSLSLAAAGGITINGGITTGGTQAYHSPVTLDSDATLTGTDVDLAAGLTGAGFGLTVAGNATLGTATGLSALSVSGTSSLDGDVTTSGTQTYSGGVTLGSAATLAGTGVDLTGGVTGGGFGLTITGDATLGSTAGLDTLSVSGDTLLKGNVTTIGAQNYTGAVTLGNDVLLTTGGGAVTFDSMVDNANSAAPASLGVATGAGIATFTGAAGSLNGALAGLTVNSGSLAAGALTIDGPLSITTASGGISQTGAFTVTGDSTFTAGGNAITLNDSGNHFSGTVSLNNTGAHNVTLNNGTNALTLGTSSVGSGSFSLPGTGDLTFAGTLTTAGGAVDLTGPIALSAASGIDTTGSGASGAAIHVAGAVDGNYDLTLTAGTGAIKLDGPVGGTSALAGLTTTSKSLVTNTLNIGSDGLNVTTDSAIAQGDAYTVLGTSTFTAGGHAITLDDSGNHFTGAVSLDNSGANDVTLNNGTNPLTLGTSSVGSGTFSLTSGALTLAGDLTTSGGAFSVTGPISFGATPVTISTTGAGTSGGAAIDFGGTLTGTSDLILDAGTGGVVTLGGTVGLGSLVVSHSGGIALNADVTTSGQQTYTGATTLGQDLTLSSTGGGDIDLAGTVNGTHALAVNTTGTTTLGGVVGGSANLTSLTTDVGGGTTLNGNVTTTTTQSYGDTLTLGSDTILKGSSVSLAGVNGGTNDLGTIGATTLNGALTGVGKLSITGTTTVATTAVSTSGDQTYDGAMTLGDDVTLTSTGGGAIDLAGTVDGAHGLTVNTTGATTFADVVGGSTGLISLTTDAMGGTTLGSDVTATTQSYGDTVTLGGDTILTGSSVTLTGVTGASHDLTVDGAAALRGAVAGVGTLSVTGGTDIATATVDTSGDQTYTGAVLLGANTVLTSGGTGGVLFGSTVDNASGTARTLEVDAANGAVTFTGAVGNGTNGALSSLTTSSGSFSAGPVNAGSLAVTTTSGDITQAAGGLFTITGASSFKAGTDDITLDQANVFGGAVSLAGNNVVLNNTGALALGPSTVDGTLGVTAGGSITQSPAGTSPLKVIGASTFTVTAAGSDVLLKDPNNDLAGAVTVGASGSGSVNDLWLTNTSTTAGSFTPPATFTGNLTLDYANAALTLATTNLGGALDVTAGLGITLNGDVTTGGSQTYGSAVLLGTGVTLTSTGGGAIDLTQTVDGTAAGAQSLTVNTSGATTFGGAVGGTSSLKSLTTDVGGTTTLGGNVTTTAAQSYGDAVLLADATILESTSGSVTLGGTVDNADSVSGRALEIDAATGVTFSGAVGGTNGALGSLAVTSNADLTQAAPFAVAGISSFAVGGHAITLTAQNLFAGPVSLSNSGANDVALTNAGALELGDSALGSGKLTLTATGISQTSGTAITQAAGAGTTTLDASTGALVLTNPDNDFTGSVDATGQGVQLVAAHDLDVATLTSPINFAVNLTAGDTLTVPTGAMDTGTADLTLVSGGTLTMPGELTGNNITLTSDGDLLLDNALNGAGAIILTSSAGNISQTAAGIISTATGSLAGTSGGDTTLLNPGNTIATLGKFVTGGNFSFNNAQALTVNHPVLANGGLGNITLTTTGAGSDLVLATQIQGTDVTLGAGGAISQTAAGTIQASTLTGTSTGNTALTGPNEVDTLKAFTSGGDFSFTNAQGLTVVGPLSASSGNITLSTNSGVGGDLLLNTGITAANVELDAGGAITQQAGTVITAATLTGDASGDVALDGANLITTLNDFNAANFSVVNAQDLTVAGTLTTTGGTGSISLQTTAGTLSVASDLTGGAITLDSASDLTLNQSVTGTDTVALKSGGAIYQTAGIITAGTLSGNSTDGATLADANQIAALGDFTANGFSLTNSRSLAINGALDGGSSVELKTTAGDLTEGTGGVITAATLTGSSAGDTTLGGSNLVDTLSDFSAVNFSLVNAKDLALSGTLTTTGSPGTISLKTTTGTLSVNSNLTSDVISLISANDLALGQTIDGSVSVNLGAGGAITQNAGGVIQTALLTGTSGGSTTLDQGNIVAVLGNFTTGGNFSFNSAQSLTVNNPVSANNGLGNITLTTSGASSDLELDTQIKGTTVTLGATGKITQTSAGTIQAATLTGNSGGDTTLTGPNQAGTLGMFSTGGNFSFANAKTLTVTGPLSAPGGTINLSSAAGSGGDLLLNTGINADTVSLAAGGAITQQAGTAIQANTLTGSATGKVALDGANLIGTLGAFTAAGFSLSNAQGLTVNGPLTTSGDVSLTTTSGVLDVNTDLAGAAISLASAGDLTLAHAVNGTSIALQSGGNISQAPTGSLTAATLTGSSVGSTVLGGSGGGIGALGDFSANSFSLTNGQSLAVNGVLDGGPSVVLKTTAGDLTINGAVKGTATTLTSAGAIGEGDAGVLSAATLTGSSVGATTLASTHNAVGALNGFTAQGFSLTSSQALTVNNVLDGGDSVALTTTAGDLKLVGAVHGATTKLTAAGALNEGPNGTLSATTLSGSSGGDTTLNGVNQIATLGQFAAQNLDLTNAQALAVAGPVTITNAGRLHLTTTAGGLTINGALSGGDVVLTAAGDLALNQAVKGTTVALVSGGNISQTDNGILTAGTLTGSSTGSTDLDPVNHVDTLGSFSADGFSLATDHALTVVGPVTGGPILLLKTTNGDLAINGAVSGKAATLISAGAISEGSGGSLVADTLTGSSVGATTLDAAGNLVGTLNAFDAGSFSLTTGQALTIADALNGGSALTLTATKGDLLINAGLSSSGLTTLNSAGAITEGAGGSITAGTLTGNAVGPTMLGSAAVPMDNYIGTLGGFVSPTGFSLTNNQTLTLASVNGSTYTVDAGTSATYLAVLTGDLLQSGSNWLRNGTGTWSSAGAMGTGRAPIYVLGTGAQQIDAVGFPPAYFYALDAQGNLLQLTGAASFNVPTSALTSHAQNSNNHTDAYIDPSIITARYRAFGMVPPGILLPPDQRCDPNTQDCPSD